MPHFTGISRLEAVRRIQSGPAPRLTFNGDIGIKDSDGLLHWINSAGTEKIAAPAAAALTAKSFVYSDASGNIAATSAPTNGQLLIGSTGAIPVAAALTGTANRVTVTNGAGSITLSGPQDLATGSSPTFVGLTLSGTVALAGATITGAPTWSSSQAITLSTAAQPNVTSLGTLTGLTVGAFTDITAGGLRTSGNPTVPTGNPSGGASAQARILLAAGTTGYPLVDFYLGATEAGIIGFTQDTDTIGGVAMAQADLKIIVGGTFRGFFDSSDGGRLVLGGGLRSGGSVGINVAPVTALHVQTDVNLVFSLGKSGVRRWDWSIANTSGNLSLIDNTIGDTTMLTITSGGGFQIGSPTGADKGGGTLNANAVYDDGVILTDWVFDLHFDGQVRPDDPFWRGQRLYSLAEVYQIASDNRRLAWMPTRVDFEQERSLGGMISRLWLGQEQQQIYLFDHEHRIAALEAENRELRALAGRAA